MFVATLDPRDDHELLLAWLAGDRAAGEELFRRYYDLLHRFFYNKVNEPSDLIQRTFLECLEAAHRFRGDSRFSTFLLGIAYNVLRDHARELRRQRGIEPLDGTSVEDLGQTPSQILVERQEQRVLLAALRRLPLEVQVLLELRYWEGLKHTELADLLGLPRSTVNGRLRRARELLERRLDELDDSPELLSSTLMRLDDWAEQLRRGSARDDDDDDDDDGDDDED